jgi:hypothetical protein
MASASHRAVSQGLLRKQSVMALLSRIGNHRKLCELALYCVGNDPLRAGRAPFGQQTLTFENESER